MNKYHFRINNSVKHNTAGSKAVDDCRKIMLMNGYIDLEIYFTKSVFLMPYNFIKLLFFLLRYLIIVKKNSLIVVQYPLLGINNFFKYYAQLLKLKGCKLACIIHDIESLRTTNSKIKFLKEINALNAYSAVIAHNNFMSTWLLQNGYKGFINKIILFDYLITNNNYKEKISHQKYNNEKITIAFAGNLGSLGKSNFLKILCAQNNDFSINLYGPGFVNTKHDYKVTWHGSFSPNEIVNELTGDFGLIWDGDSLEDISGLMGDYLKYNSPHKTSLYLTAGLPVIVSENAAVSEFIKNNNLGICIKELNEISKKTKETDIISYNKMRDNVKQINHRLKRGHFLSSALKDIEDHFLKKSCIR